MKKKKDKKKNQLDKLKDKEMKVFMFKFDLKKILIWALILVLFLPGIVSLVSGGFSEEITVQRAMKDIKAEKVQEVTISGDSVELKYSDTEFRKMTKEEGESFGEILERHEVPLDAVEYTVEGGGIWGNLGAILNIASFLLMGLFFFVILRQARGSQNNLFGFGKSTAQRFAKGKQDVTFEDVAGVDEAKRELEEVVDFLENPEKYRKLGARTPKGVLLVGEAGVGKTLLAKAVAGEAEVPFFSIAGSEFMEMLVGVGASVTGDTPVLVKDNGEVKLLEIGKFVDEYYDDDEDGFTVSVEGVETLGLSREENGFGGSKSSKRPVFGGSNWRRVDQVYRHKVDEIYEIEYLGGILRTTGDHSVFVREQGGIRAKEVRELGEGDLLVNLPMNTKAWNEEQKTTQHTIKKHEFDEVAGDVWLDVWQDDEGEWEKYEYARSKEGEMSQKEIAEKIGVSQITVSNWQRGKHVPQKVSKKLVKMDFPDKVKVSVKLCKLFGYYTAEGKGKPHLEFVFGKKEKGYISEVQELMKEVFGVEAELRDTKTNTTRAKYYSAHLGRFFASYCGEGSHNKHVPEFLWSFPEEYFLAYLEGYTNGDGYVRKSGELCASSVSHQLIRELVWLCAMHGIKVGIKHEIIESGRVINEKQLPETECWKLIIGKTSNPFCGEVEYPNQFKRCIVRSVKKRGFDGYVYDLCGVEQEAFFGGEKPVLLHNSRVRDLFEKAKESSPAIIFIDELDAIGRKRGRASMTGHDEREQTLNQILVEMDGFGPRENVIVMAATNRPDVLDQALVRPGRFDRRVKLDMPDIEGRKEILKIHAKGKPFAEEVTWQAVAKRTVGFSGADLENMLNEAAIRAAVEGKSEIYMDDIEEAATKVKMGPKKKRLQSERERRMTAYHEAGHAVVSHFLSRTDPVHRISIVSRGLALGFTMIPPAQDKYQRTRSELLEKISTLLGGRVAEEMIFEEMTVGAASDIDNVTKISRDMVVEYGMSKLGPVDFGPREDTTEWGRTFVEPSDISESKKSEIDGEVKRIVNAAKKTAEEILKDHREEMDKVVEKLMEVETLDGDEFEELMGIEKDEVKDSSKYEVEYK